MAFDWTEVQPAGDVGRTWYPTGSDDNFSLIVAGSFSRVAGLGRLYTSVDNGNNWTERQPAGDVDRQWVFSVADSDGSVILVGVEDEVNAGEGRIYISEDSGANWSEVQPAGNVDRNWYNGAVDSDGSFTVVTSYSNIAGKGRVYTSANTGSSWTERQPDGDVDRKWTAADVLRSDGSIIIVGSFDLNTGGLFRSTDSGVNWSEIYPQGVGNWGRYQDVSMSSDGSVIVTVENGQGDPAHAKVWLSIDSGANWSDITPAGETSTNFKSCMVSADGSKILVCAGTSSRLGRVWYSDDQGSSWTEERPTGVDEGKAWAVIGSDSDLTKIIIADENSGSGRLFVGGGSVSDSGGSTIMMSANF